MNPQDAEMLRHLCRCPRKSNQLFGLLVLAMLVAENANMQLSTTIFVGTSGRQLDYSFGLASLAWLGCM